MEAVNINLQGINNSLGGSGKTPQNTEGFSDILNMIMGVETQENMNLNIDPGLKLPLEGDLEENLEETLAYLLEGSIINQNGLNKYANLNLNSKDDLETQITNLKEISNKTGLNSNLDDISKGITNTSKDVPKEISKEALKDMDLSTLESSSKLKTIDSLDKGITEHSKIGASESFSKELEIKDLSNEKSLNSKENKLNSSPKLSLEKRNLDINKERILNFNTSKEDTLNLKPEELVKNAEEKLSNKEKMEIKPFNLEDIQNSFRKIETKDIFSKEINSTKLSQENIEIVKDSIVKLIDINGREENPTMNVKLIPKDLGSIDISLKMEEGKLVAKILFENEQARQLFSNNMKDLNQNLQRQDISIEEIQIDLNSNNDRGSNSEGRQFQSPYKNRNIIVEEKDSLDEIKSRSQIMESGVSILV